MKRKHDPDPEALSENPGRAHTRCSWKATRAGAIVLVLAMIAPTTAAADCTFKPEDEVELRECLQDSCREQSENLEKKNRCEKSLKDRWGLIEHCRNGEPRCIDDALNSRLLLNRLEEQAELEQSWLSDTLAEAVAEPKSDSMSKLVQNPLGYDWYACQYRYNYHPGKQATRFDLHRNGTVFQGTMFVEGSGWGFQSPVEFSPMAGGKWRLVTNNGAITCRVDDIYQGDQFNLEWCSNAMEWMNCARMRSTLAFRLVAANYPVASCLQKTGWQQLQCYENSVMSYTQGLVQQYQEAVANGQQVLPGLAEIILWCSQNWFTGWLCVQVMNLDRIAHDIGYIPDEGRGCNQSSDCPGFLWCVGGRCERTGLPDRGTPCNYDWDCPSNLTCRSGACNDLGGTGGACDSDADCKSGHRCSRGACQKM